MLDAARAAAKEIFSPPFRNALFKTLALTLALLALVWIGLDKLIVAALHSPHLMAYPWLINALSVASGVGLFVGLAFLVTPASFIVAGFFFDELAAHVEADIDPARAGRPLALGESVRVGAEFAVVALVVNLAALLLLFVPGVNAFAFFGANAYLFGRGYFELAALRHLPRGEVARLRAANELRLFMAGLVMAAMLAAPFLNLLTPLFGTAFMVRIADAIMPKPAPAAAPPQRQAV